MTLSLRNVPVGYIIGKHMKSKSYRDGADMVHYPQGRYAVEWQAIDRPEGELDLSHWIRNER